MNARPLRKWLWLGAVVAACIAVVNSSAPSLLTGWILQQRLAQAGWEVDCEQLRWKAGFSLECHGLTLRHSHASAAIQIHRLDARLQPWAYLRGASALAQSLDISGLRVQLDSRTESSHVRNAMHWEKWFPETFLLHDANVLWQMPHGSLEIQNLFLNADENTNGLMAANVVVINARSTQQRFDALRGITAWRSGVLYLADIRPRDGIVLDDLMVEAAPLFSGKLRLDAALRLAEGYARLACDYDFVSSPGRTTWSCWMGYVPVVLLTEFVPAPVSQPDGTITALKLNYHSEGSRLHTASLVLDANDFRWNERQFESLKAAAVLTDDWLEVYELDLVQAGNSFRFRGDTELPEDLDDWVQGRFSFNVTGSIRNPDELMSLLPWPVPETGGTAQIAGYATGQMGQIRGDLKVQWSAPAWGEVNAESAEFHVQMDGSELRLVDVNVKNGPDRLMGSGYFDVSGTHRYSAQWRAEIADMADYGSLLPTPWDRWLVGGALHMHGNADGVEGAHTGGVRAVAKNMKMRWHEEALPVDVDIDASFSPEAIVIRRLEMQQGDSSLQASGSATQNRVRMDPVRVQQGEKETVVGSFDFPWSWSRAWHASSIIGGLDGSDDASLTLSITQLDLDRATRLSGIQWPVEGTIDLQISLGGSFNNPEWTGEGSIQDGQFGFTTAKWSDIQGAFALANDRVTLREMQGRLNGIAVHVGGDVQVGESASVDLKMTSDPWEVTLGGHTAMSVNPQLHLHGPWHEVVLTGQANVTKLELGVLPIIYKAGDLAALPDASWEMKIKNLPVEIIHNLPCNIKLVGDLDRTWHQGKARAALQGDVQMQGTLSAPTMQGRVTIADIPNAAGGRIEELTLYFYGSRSPWAYVTAEDAVWAGSTWDLQKFPRSFTGEAADAWAELPRLERAVLRWR